MDDVIAQLGYRDELPLVATDLPGPKSHALANRLAAAECPAFGVRRDKREELAGEAIPTLVLERGLGSSLFDVDGNRFVDLVAGFGSVLIGHSPAPLRQAISSQSEQLIQGLGDVYATSVKVELLETLNALFPGGDAQTLLAQSGGDAVTAALKTAHLATGKAGVVAFDGAYHGLGYAPLAACGFKQSFRAPFSDALNPHACFSPFPSSTAELDPSLTALRKHLARGDVGAVLIEPIQGRGGVVIPPAGFLSAVADLTREHGALLIADEIWTGLGRAGTPGAVSTSVRPDIICFGKGLGGGVSIAACAARRDVMAAWPGAGEVVHTSTHVGAPLSCAAALTTLAIVEKYRLAERAASLGEAFVASLQRHLTNCPGVVDVRGQGLMVGVELDSSSRALRALGRWLARGYVGLSGGRKGQVITLTPALTVSSAQLDAAAGALAESLS